MTVAGVKLFPINTRGGDTCPDTDLSLVEDPHPCPTPINKWRRQGLGQTTPPPQQPGKTAGQLPRGGRIGDVTCELAVKSDLAIARLPWCLKMLTHWIRAPSVLLGVMEAFSLFLKPPLSV